MSMLAVNTVSLTSTSNHQFILGEPDGFYVIFNMLGEQWLDMTYGLK